jgi:hypothetical protein
MALVTAAGGLSALGSALLAGGSAAAAGAAGIIAGNKKRKQDVEDQTRFVLDPVLKDKQEEDFGSSMMDREANLTLRPGGRPIVFNNRRF